MNAVLGLSELSLRTTASGPLDEEQRIELHESLTVISREARRCKEIVNSLLDFAHQRKRYHEPVDLNAALRISRGSGSVTRRPCDTRSTSTW